LNRKTNGVAVYLLLFGFDITFNLDFTFRHPLIFKMFPYVNHTRFLPTNVNPYNGSINISTFYL